MHRFAAPLVAAIIAGELVAIGVAAEKAAVVERKHRVRKSRAVRRLPGQIRMQVVPDPVRAERTARSRFPLRLGPLMVKPDAKVTLSTCAQLTT